MHHEALQGEHFFDDAALKLAASNHRCLDLDPVMSWPESRAVLYVGNKVRDLSGLQAASSACCVSL